MNVRLLRKVKEAILAEPARVDMLTWGETVESRIRRLAEVGGPVKKLPEPPCNTVACIAGWSCLVELKDPQAGLRRRIKRQGRDDLALRYCPFWDAEPEARRKLGLDFDQADRLFQPDQWPEPFLRKLKATRTGTSPYARVVAGRIDHFIKTKGAE